MTRNNPRAGQGGRPRTFQDDDFFHATTTVLAASGYGGLTLEAVARQLGCTGAAVSRRFGSKRGLVHAYLEWAIEATTRRFQEVREEYASPVDALRARSLIPANQRPEEIGDPADPDHQAHMATFWAQMQSDPEFRPIVTRHILAADDATADLLRAAIAAGELAECDPDEVGRVLTAAWSFTTHFWPGDSPEGTLEERLGRIFDTVIGPYRTDR